MSSRSAKRALGKRDSRRAQFDAMRNTQGRKRPGSLNPRKGR